MIYDQISNAHHYYKLLPQLEKGMEFVQSCGENPPAGRVELDGDALYASVQHYTTAAADAERCEVHEKYIDVQLLLQGRETIGMGRLPQGAPPVAVDPEKDAGFVNCPTWPLTLEPGWFAVFLPGEPHQPCLPAGAPQDVVKVVLKVRADG